MEQTDLLDQDLVETASMNDFTYPLELNFKIGTIANDFTVTDGNQKTVAYVKQKMFKLKEAISVFKNDSKTELLYKINADRMIDFNANYSFDKSGVTIGKVGRKGRKSILKAHYNIFNDADQQLFTINEENPWAKVFDTLLCEIPLVGIFSGYFFNPKYIVKNNEGTIVARLSKEKSFFGRRFKLEKTDKFSAQEGEMILLSIMMMSLLERRRG